MPGALVQRTAEGLRFGVPVQGGPLQRPFGSRRQLVFWNEGPFVTHGPRLLLGSGRLTVDASGGSQDLVEVGADRALLSLNAPLADAPARHLLAVVPDRAEFGTAAGHAPFVALRYLRQAPESGFATVALDPPDSGFAVALSGFRLAAVRVRTCNVRDVSG